MAIPVYIPPAGDVEENFRQLHRLLCHLYAMLRRILMNPLELHALSTSDDHPIDDDVFVGEDGGGGGGGGGGGDLHNLIRNSQANVRNFMFVPQPIPNPTPAPTAPVNASAPSRNPAPAPAPTNESRPAPSTPPAAPVAPPRNNRRRRRPSNSDNSAGLNRVNANPQMLQQQLQRNQQQQQQPNNQRRRSNPRQQRRRRLNSNGKPEPAVAPAVESPATVAPPQPLDDWDQMGMQLRRIAELSMQQAPDRDSCKGRRSGGRKGRRAARQAAARPQSRSGEGAEAGPGAGPGAEEESLAQWVRRLLPSVLLPLPSALLLPHRPLLAAVIYLLGFSLARAALPR